MSNAEEAELGLNRIHPAAVWAFAIVLCIGADVSAQIQNLTLSREARVRYNRVEGLFIGYQLEIEPTSSRDVAFQVGGGYGLHNTEPRWDVGVEIDKPKWFLSGTIFDRTTSPNESIIRPAENTVFTFLFKGDYLDYFRAKHGFEVNARYKATRFLSFVGYLSAFQYRNMPVDVSWTVFRGDEAFRPNPIIREGDAGLAKIGISYTNKRKSPVFRNAWVASAVYERGFREFPYNGLALSFKRYQKTIFGKQAFVLRGLLGSRESIDEQHLYDIGGISTLRGYRIKEYTGNRIILFNVDYLFRGDIVGKISSRAGQFVELIGFADAGWVTLRPKADNLIAGFGDFRFGDLKYSAGGAISLYRQLIRFNVARRFDSDIDDWTFSVRFRRQF